MDNPHQDEQGRWWALTEAGGWRPMPSAQVIHPGAPPPARTAAPQPAIFTATATATATQRPPRASRPPRRRWRVLTWVMLVINLGFVAWIVAGIVGTATADRDCGTLTAEMCDAATGIGATIGLAFILAIWAFVDLILLVLWLVTRPRR